jgi:hypothetical protein
MASLPNMALVANKVMKLGLHSRHKMKGSKVRLMKGKEIGSQGAT